MLNKIEEIAKAVGDEKIEVMKRYPHIKEILLYAYDPFRKYYMVDPDIQGHNDQSSGAKGMSVFRLLDDLADRVITGDAALEAVCDLAIQMNHDSAELLKRIINKDLRAGISVKSINKAFPGLIPTCHTGEDKPAFMLLKDFRFDKAVFPCLAAIKEDGVRGRYVGHMLSRQGKPLVGLDHITSQLKGFPYEVEGEVVVPDMEFDDASGAIRSKDETPDAIFRVFDIPDYPGHKLQRLGAMVKMFKGMPSISVIKHHRIADFPTLMNFFDKSVADGEEGIVYYNPFSTYEDERGYNWMRLCPLYTSDCKVVGFYEGKGKLVGMLGGVIVDYEGHEVRVGGGFKEKTELKQKVIELDKKEVSLLSLIEERGKGKGIEIASQNIRQYIWDNKELFLGAIAECAFKNKTKAGAMRQPRFKRWRWEK